MDYNVTHIRDWYCVKVKFYYFDDAKRKQLAEMFCKKFVYTRAVFYEDLDTNYGSYYNLYFKERENVMIFALACNEALYYE